MQKLLRRILYLGFWLLFTLVSGAALTAAGVYLYLSPNLPNVDDLYEVKLQIPLRIYTSDGELIGEFGEKRRTPVTYEQIPQKFVNALLAAEDSHFETHSGVAIRGLLRATVELALTGEKQTGGSTLTMQVARNFFLSRERTFTRKFNEILLALEIERKLTKEQIFELYVNKIFWGNRAYGVEAAAKVYYGKRVSELTLAQCAMIAGLPKAPSTFNPIVNPSRALTRRNWILRRMLDLSYISAEEHAAATEEPITATLHGAEIDLDAPYAAELARANLLDMFGKEVYGSGMAVYTTIDSKSQRSANRALRAGIMDYDVRHGYRGPEGHSFEPGDDVKNLENWHAVLEDTRTVNGLVPAIVTATYDDHIEILLRGENTARVELANGLQQARLFQSENSLGPEVESAKEVCQVGDLIRVYALDEPSAATTSLADIEALPEDNSDDDRSMAAVTWHFAQLPDVQASLFSMNPNNGAIKAIVGGFDFQSSKFNRAVQGERQPGSNFKPFIYAAALDHGFTAASLFNDAPVVMADAELENTWRPENASGKFYGPTRLRKALYLSRNLVSVRLLRTITPKTAISYVEAFGFDTARLPKDLSLSLGSHAVTPQEIARGYSTLANGGFLVDPYIVQRIESETGELVFEANPPLANCEDCVTNEEAEEDQPGQTGSTAMSDAENSATRSEEIEGASIEGRETEELDTDAAASLGLEIASRQPQPALKRAAPRVIDARIAYIIDDILKDVIRRGTGTKAQSLNRRDIAGKTGTTNGPVDAWFSGYNPSLVTTVWLGFDQNQFLGRREYGGSAALPIWIQYMSDALAGQPEIIRPRPEGLTSMRIDPETGLLASPLQDNAIFELFRLENAPVDRAPDPVGSFNQGVQFEGEMEGLEGGAIDNSGESLEELF
ncbi:MAG: penicillin-binding protein 1A [Pseudomonadales bacterium]